MSFRPGPSTQQRQGSNGHPNLTIRLPTSPNIPPPVISTPTNSHHPAYPSHVSSPRRAPLPPSPTHSLHGPASWTEERARSLDISRSDQLASRDKRLPMLPGSPHKGASSGSAYAGAYDNRLVSTTLSQLPPIPTAGDIGQPPPAPLLKSASSHTSVSTASARPSFSTPPALGVLSNSTVFAPDQHELPGGSNGRSVIETLHHSSASSPWSLLTVHALPLFAGGPLRTPIEDLNQLCHAHILGTAQRASPSRILPVLSSDFREFVASGMLTLRAKFETLEENKIISRAAEVWSFFWTQILPYLEGVFLPFAQMADLPPSSTVPIRLILLSGFLVHILLPLLPRLVPLLSTSPDTKEPELHRLLQMSLVLSTQARFSAFVPGHEGRDKEIRQAVENVGRTVRRRLAATLDSVSVGTNRLSRGMSIGNGRWRRRGWRASAAMGQSSNQIPAKLPLGEDADIPFGDSLPHPLGLVASTLGTAIDNTLRTDSFDQKTPQPTYVRRPTRAESGGSSDLTPVAMVNR